jgi:hypothetical protein
MVHREIIGRYRRAEYDGRKISRLAVGFRARDELDDFCAHESPSHSAMATRPASESEIKYAVMAVVSESTYPSLPGLIRQSIQKT